MAGKAQRMIAPEDARELAALIEKRLAQGLPKSMIAARLGITPAQLLHYQERGAKLLAKEART